MNAHRAAETQHQPHRNDQKTMFEPANVAVMSKMLQFAMETFLAEDSATDKYSDPEATVLSSVEATLKRHFLMASHETITPARTSAFFKRLNAYVDDMSGSAANLVNPEIHDTYRNVMMLSVDWGLVTGMIDIPEHITRH